MDIAAAPTPPTRIAPSAPVSPPQLYNPNPKIRHLARLHGVRHLLEQAEWGGDNPDSELQAILLSYHGDMCIGLLAEIVVCSPPVDLEYFHFNFDAVKKESCCTASLKLRASHTSAAHGDTGDGRLITFDIRSRHRESDPIDVDHLRRIERVRASVCTAGQI